MFSIAVITGGTIFTKNSIEIHCITFLHLYRSQMIIAYDQISVAFNIIVFYGNPSSYSVFGQTTSLIFWNKCFVYAHNDSVAAGAEIICFLICFAFEIDSVMYCGFIVNFVSRGVVFVSGGYFACVKRHC